MQIHIGQCGIQIAHACWELYCLEHGILPDGRLVGNCPGNNTTPFFETAASGKITPRVILADLEPTTIGIDSIMYKIVYGSSVKEV